jgi:multidrug resistance efflux pump
MKRNQLVEVRVDAIPDVKFEGRIASISDATGASYSLIPQNNSAGNFVKVEQRTLEPRTYNSHPAANISYRGHHSRCSTHERDVHS